ncbi:MAG: hypothetical protein RL701_6229 [Pseudomonadota bacterium]
MGKLVLETVERVHGLRPVLITENYPPDRGGMAQSCDRIVRGLRARGVHVDVVHLSGRHAGLHIEQHEHGRLLRCPVEDDAAHAINVLWNALQQQVAAPTHVLAFGGFLPLLCAPSFAAWLGVPLLTLLRGNDFDTGIVSPRRGWILRDALQRSAAVSVVTRDHQHKVQALFPSQHVRYVPNGIDAAHWAVLEVDQQRARAFREREVLPGRKVIGLFGHLKQKKGGVFFLDALEHCALAARAHLLVVGDVEPLLQERLDALRNTLGVTQLPFLDRLELLPWYATCHFMAIPSLYDGMPNVVLEAGALGIPVLASTAGGLADVLGGDCSDFTFAPGDTYACRRALDAALGCSLAELGASGAKLRANVLEHFNERLEAARYHTLLLDTVTSTPTVS